MVDLKTPENSIIKPTYKVHVPLHSGVIQAFVKTSNPTEVSYYPIQAVRKCFRWVYFLIYKHCFLKYIFIYHHMVFTLDLFIFSNRNVHSGVDCNTIKVAYDYSYSNKLLGFGGLLGLGAPGCPPNFYPIGKDCINLPIQSASLFENILYKYILCTLKIFIWLPFLK